jgi:2-oxoglutarate dehydrogenase E1 component
MEAASPVRSGGNIMVVSRTFEYMQLAHIKMIEDLHARFLTDPESVEASWHHFFEGMEFGQTFPGKETRGGDVRVAHLIDAYRTFGHLQAHINPLAQQKKAHELTLEALGFEERDLSVMFPTYGLLRQKEAPLATLIATLEEIYCGTKGIEYMGIHSSELQLWVQHQIEPTRFRSSLTHEEKKQILNRLNQAELFETFLHTKYVGQKRFSLEGGETLIPILDAIIDQGAKSGMEDVVIGMSHRGRLNVLVNILNKSFSMVFSEFEDFLDPHSSEGAGDVKYHKGFSASVTTSTGIPVHISLTANPSHLESVDPVVQGKTRAKQELCHDVLRTRVIPLLIHGDASLAGQGVVYETLQMYNLAGYTTGGTIHIVLNNQIGFTTLPHEYRSSSYCTDIAHTFGFPVFHVNAEDPEGCVYATRLALAIRRRFQCDVFIELNCYRKYGHNEGDEPAFTQPIEYNIIRNKKSIREIYRDQLIQEGVVEKKIALQLEEEFKAALHYELEEMKIKKEAPITESLGGIWSPYQKVEEQELVRPIDTRVEEKVLQEIGQQMCKVPAALSIHKKLLKVIEERQKMVAKERSLDWATAEQLAFGSLLWEGVGIRLSGQDSQRGTFTQRHAVWVDQNTGGRYFPLAHLKEGQGAFSIYNSSLSEYAALGFEWGYSLVNPTALVLWEAQFGDFANGAQIIFDQYMAASAQKWQRYSGLVVLLPHGYEGQGAEHSSARLERFLQLAADANIQVVYPTTPAQYFHLLRRQIVRPVRVPLVVMTPKGLLRHPECVSSLDIVSTGRFQEILDDPLAVYASSRLLLCSGRIYYDLIQERKKRGEKKVAVIRIEQLYPLLLDNIMQVLGKYPGAQEYFWVQEEPYNMGAWSYISPHFLHKGVPLQYVGRPASGPTATGSHAQHEKEYVQLMQKAFG